MSILQRSTPLVDLGTRREIQIPDAYSGIGVLEVMTEARNYNRYLISLIDAHLKPGLKVLDFGAGAGTFALPLVRRGVDLVCVEPDAALNARLRDAGARAVAGIEDIEEESVDFIYTFNVLEHILDHAAAVRALRSKLKPGGTLLVYVPAFQILYSSFDRKVGHLRRYRRKSLSALIDAAGLRIIACRYADSAGFLIAWLYRLLGQEQGNITRRALRFYDRIIFPISKVCDKALSPWLGKNLLLVSIKS